MKQIIFTTNELLQLEDTLRQVEIASMDGIQPYTLDPADWQAVCVKVGASFQSDGPIVFTEREAWAIIRLLSVFARIGQDPVGLTIKTKLYDALATSFLDDYTTVDEVTYASKDRAESSTEDSPEDRPATTADATIQS